MTDSPADILAPRDLSRGLTLRFSALLLLFLALSGGTYFAVSSAVSAKEYDSSVVNLAGRQRMLTLKYACEINQVLVALAVSDWELAAELKEAACQTTELYEAMLAVLFEGGEVDAGEEGRVWIPPVQGVDLVEHLGRVQTEWEELRRIAIQVMHSDSPLLTKNDHAGNIQVQTAKAVAEMDHVVLLMQKQSEARLRRVGSYMIYACILSAMLFVGTLVFVRRKIVTPLDHSITALKTEIAEREQAQKQIEILARFPSQNPDPVLRIDGKGTILYANDAALPLLHFFGTPIGRPAPVAWRQTVADVLRRGGAEEIEVTCGKQIFGLTIAPVPEAGYVNVYGPDITERKRAEDVLAQTQQAAVQEVAKLRSMIEGMDEGIVVADADDMITEVNGWFLDKTGLGRDDIVGKSLWEFHPDIEVTARVRAVLNGFRSGESRRTRIVNRELLGMQLSLRAQPIYDGDRYQGAILNVINVTDLAEACDAAESARATLQETNALLEVQTARAGEMAARAEMANSAKSQFLANMSHEIRTPMTAILGYADVMSEGLTDPVSIDAVRTIKRNGQHLLELINDILDLSKVESGKMTMKNQRCDLMQLIGDTAASLRPKAEAKNIHLDVKYAGAVPQTICTDPTRLRQALMNLAANAIKFTSQGGVTIRVGLLGSKSGPELLIEVVDTGIGIPPDSLNAIFEPFQQADSSTSRKFGGTGLGLTISKRIAELLGGGLEVHSEVGKGSLFSLRVTTGPLEGVEMIDQPVDEAGSRYEAEKQRATEELDCRILLVEDGPDNQRLIAFILKKAGAEVEVADNGKIGADLALAAASEGRPFDVILMDMQMPVMDGYAATALLRRKGYTGPIIALTAHAMAGDREKCLHVGCDDYATKPIDRKKLIAAIQKHLTAVFGVQQ